MVILLSLYVAYRVVKYAAENSERAMGIWAALTNNPDANCTLYRYVDPENPSGFNPGLGELPRVERALATKDVLFTNVKGPLEAIMEDEVDRDEEK